MRPGSAAAAPTQQPRSCSRTTCSPTPLAPERLGDLAATIGADVPFFLGSGPQLGTGDGTVLAPVDLPRDYWVVLVVPRARVKTSTADVYRAFDARDGAAGFADASGDALSTRSRLSGEPRPRPAPAERSRVVARCRAAARAQARSAPT